MKKVLLLCLFLIGCGEREVKKMIIEPFPPEPVAAMPVDCGLHFNQSDSLKQTAIVAARIAEACGYDKLQIKSLIESDLN